MNIVKTYIDRSPIQGIGLFAGEFIPRNTIMWELGGLDQLMTDEQLKSNQFTSKQLSYLKRYIYFINGYWVYCSDDAKFTNHSLDPNSSVTFREQIATKDIQIGEEITCNYHELDTNFTEEEFNDN